MAVTNVEVHRWTRQEYERMVEAGLLDPDARVELIEGILYDMTPQSSFHSTGVRAVHETLREVFASGYDIRVQMPLALEDCSEPEPDLAVVPGRFTDFAFAHPTTAALVVEVADSSLRHDRQVKLPLYARAGIPEVWILDLKRTALEVYRDPVEGAYQTRTVLRPGDSVSPLARSEAVLPVASFFPWER